MSKWRKSHPSSLLYYSWGGMVKFQLKKDGEHAVFHYEVHLQY